MIVTQILILVNSITTVVVGLVKQMEEMGVVMVV